MTKSYAVGEVLYLISNRQRQVLPMQVEEEINRRTLKGETVSYRVRLPGADKSVDISSLRGHGEIVSSIEAVRTHLEESARRAIEEVVQDAIENAAASFDLMALDDAIETTESDSAQPDTPGDGVDSSALATSNGEKKKRKEVVLPDGTRANLTYSGVQ